MVTHCPIHERELIDSNLIGVKNKKEKWCPECEQRIPINLSYKELLVEYIKKTVGMDAFAASCQHFEGFVEVLRLRLVTTYNFADQKLRSLLEKAQNTHLYWSKEGSPGGSPNILDLIYYKCQMEIVEELQNSLKLYEDGEDPPGHLDFVMEEVEPNV